VTRTVLLEIYRRFSETSVNFYQTTRRLVAGNSIFQSLECIWEGTLMDIDVCDGIEDSGVPRNCFRRGFNKFS